MTPEQMDDLYSALTEADAGRDAEALAKIGWQLHSELTDALERGKALQARLGSIALTAAQDHDDYEDAGERDPCPGCGNPEWVSPCVSCHQPVDPSCGYGLEYTPGSAESPGRWRCADCQAVIAEEIRAAA
jgi:hypothetical protein